MSSDHRSGSGRDIYGGSDPVDVPAYTLAEASRWVAVPPSTVRAWALGQGEFVPVIAIADAQTPALSFRNVVELHVLSAIRRRHGVSLQKVRQAVAFVRERLGVSNPLASQAMLTDGKDLLVEWCGEYMNVSKQGQGEMRNLLEAYLERIERDARNPIRLYPFS